VWDAQYGHWAKLGPCTCAGRPPNAEYHQLPPLDGPDFVIKLGLIAWWEGEGWCKHIFLPGEEDCPLIPKSLQHSWEVGDVFWLYDRYGGWEKLKLENPYPEVEWCAQAIYVPPVAGEVRAVGGGNLFRRGGQW
jgi:hypothetical protein